MGKLDIKEQLKIKKEAQKILLNMEEELKKHETIEVLDKFKNQYNLCETTCRTVWEKYLKEEKKEEKKETFSMIQIPAALKFAGYNFEKDLLTKIFGKSDKNKSIRYLRNNVTHGLNPKAIQEIIARQDELFGYMDQFLTTIRQFDEDVA